MLVYCHSIEDRKLLGYEDAADALRLDHLTTKSRTVIEKAHCVHWCTSESQPSDEWQWVTDAQDAEEFDQFCRLVHGFETIRQPSLLYD